MAKPTTAPTLIVSSPYSLQISLALMMDSTSSFSSSVPNAPIVSYSGLWPWYSFSGTKANRPWLSSTIPPQPSGQRQQANFFR